MHGLHYNIPVTAKRKFFLILLNFKTNQNELWLTKKPVFIPHQRMVVHRKFFTETSFCVSLLSQRLLKQNNSECNNIINRTLATVQ